MLSQEHYGNSNNQSLQPRWTEKHLRSPRQVPFLLTKNAGYTEDMQTKPGPSEIGKTPGNGPTQSLCPFVPGIFISKLEYFMTDRSTSSL